jgi:hypothetical protein
VNLGRNKVKDSFYEMIYSVNVFSCDGKNSSHGSPGFNATRGWNIPDIKNAMLNRSESGHKKSKD